MQQNQTNIPPIITAEENRLTDIHAAIARSNADRSASLAKHDEYTAQLEKERLDSVDWKEKNDLAEKLRDHGHHDPRKYKVEYQQAHSPYFGIVGISDNDRKIGDKEYLIGKQMLMDGNRVVIVDWRKAEVSRMYYDYEVGDEYCETIHDRDREGTITRKDKVSIEKRVLTALETPEATYLRQGDSWVVRGEQGARPITADTKAHEKDHRLTDIVSLISSDQFQMITRETEGCTYITGGAGCGKTTVALHRLSYLQFNYPEKFRQEQCLFIVFNRVLRDYVKKSSAELLGKTRVDTFSAWSLGVAGALGITGLSTAINDNYSTEKKRACLPRLLERYVAETRRIDPVADLWRFYRQAFVLAELFGDEDKSSAFLATLPPEKGAGNAAKTVSFADIPILLRISQLRSSKDAVIKGALNWYDHIVIDEAQDFSQVELEVLLAASSPRRSMTVCADEKQQILSFVDAAGFANFRGKLNTLGLNRESLAVSYRSAREIIQLASKVIGREVDVAQAHGGTVEFHKEASQSAAIERLRAVSELLRKCDPNGLTAVICKKKADVKIVHHALAGIAGLHKEGEVSFEPGVQVVNSHQIKGLEFTNVILWNPGTNDYRQSDTDTNLLYVAITRACKRLDIIHWSPLAKVLSRAREDLCKQTQ